MLETWIDRYLRRLFPGKSFNDLFAEEKQREIRLVEATQAAIRRQQYDLHMSIAKIEAMEDWTHSRNIRKDFKP